MGSAARMGLLGGERRAMARRVRASPVGQYGDDWSAGRGTAGDGPSCMDVASGSVRRGLVC